MSSQHHSSSTYPEGRVRGPGLLYGGIGLLLAGAMQAVGLFNKGDAALKESLSEALFAGAATDDVTLSLLLMTAAVFSFGVAFAVLDSAGSWRRLLLGISAIMVVLAMVPTFAVWRIYFSPFLPTVALFWAWFCTMMYANHHVMPCDGQPMATQVPVVTRPESAQAPEEGRLPAPEAAKQRSDPNARYKPRDNDDTKEENIDGQG